MDKQTKMNVVAAVLVTVIIGLSVGASKYKETAAENATEKDSAQTIIIEQQQALKDAQREISDIKNQAEQDKNDLQNKINNVQNKVNNQAVRAELSEADIITEWKDKVAKVTCAWLNSGTEAQGSATLLSVNHSVVAITNRHVITDSRGYGPSSCIVYVYGVGGRIASENSPFIASSGGDADIALIKLDAVYQSQSFPPTDNGAFDTITAKMQNDCQNEPNLGDKIIVLGYPAIGTQKGITATQGIISGIERDYYVTDAKIDHGNSGGATILVKSDCYLGIPTWVEHQQGGFESLGRVLKNSAFLK